MRRKEVFKNIIGILATLALSFLLSGSVWAQSTYKTLYEFKGGNDGDGPWAGLVFDGAGNLYGTTFSGGPQSAGTVFELTPNSSGEWAESVLYSFAFGTDGFEPMSSLIFDAAGNLYGTTALSVCDECGVVFKLAPTADGWTETVLHGFTGGADGGSPVAGLISDGAGNLYGTGYNGGWGEFGGVFELTPNADGSWTEHTLYIFKRPDGEHPWDRLIFDSAGNLYGTTSSGTVFKLAPSSDGSWTRHTLYRFTGGKDGSSPYAGVTFDSAGNL